MAAPCSARTGTVALMVWTWEGVRPPMLVCVVYYSNDLLYFEGIRVVIKSMTLRVVDILQ